MYKVTQTQFLTQFLHKIESLKLRDDDPCDHPSSWCCLLEWAWHPLHDCPPQLMRNSVASKLHREMIKSRRFVPIHRQSRWEHQEALTNASNSHSRTSQGTKSRLSSRSWSLGLVATCSAKLDVEGSDSQLLQIEARNFHQRKWHNYFDLISTIVNSQ